MCKPAREGGRRCAAHTRPKYEAAIAAVRAAKGVEARTEVQVDAMGDIARHVSTRSGERDVMAAREEALKVGDTATGFYLTSCLNIGREMRAAYRGIEKDIAAATVDARARLARPLP